MDDPLLQAIGWFVGIMAFALALAAALGGSRRCRANLLEAARTCGGHVRLGDRGEPPRLEFLVDEVSGEFVYSPGPWARLRFRWPAPGRLRIVPRGDSALGGRRLEGTDVARYDVPELSDRYLVEGGPEGWMAAALSPQTAGYVLGLAAAGAGGPDGIPVRVEMGPWGLAVFYQGNPATDPEVLREFLGQATGLLLALRGAPGAEVRLGDAAELATGARCPVCSTGLDGRLRRCTACRTLHHEECWEYFGSCAMYACSSRRSQAVGAGGWT